MIHVKKRWLIATIGIFTLMIIVGGSYLLFIRGTMPNNKQHMKSMMNGGNTTTNQTMMEGMGHGASVDLKSTEEKERRLNIPKMLKSDRETKNSIQYTIVAKQGETQFFRDSKKTETLGYNGNYLGPVVELKKGKMVTIRTVNRLSEATTFHWHGLVVPSSVDGGPHQVVKAGETKVVKFKVKQDESTLWFHPHPMGKTAEQVYKGLAGLLYVKDEKTKETMLPQKYGENDIPLILQDRKVKNRNVLGYADVEKTDGALGDTLLVNGTINPYFNVKYSQLRVRLINGSNARNYVVKLSDGSSFKKIADDGGYISKPKNVKKIELSPGERIEVLVDFSKRKIGETVSFETNGVRVVNFKLKDKQGTNLSALAPKSGYEKPLKTLSTVNQKLILFGMGKNVEINGKKFDEKRIDIKAKQGETEIWEVYNKKDMMGGMTHPFHIHGVQFKVLERNGQKLDNQEAGLKDTIAIKPDERVKIQMTFKEKGVFMYHCHILEHEENGMMGQLKVD